MTGLSAKQCLKYILTFLFWVLTIQFAAAQVPHHGIFRLLPKSYNNLSIDFYSRYLYDLGQYFDVNFVPENEVDQYNLAYALVSVDTANGLMKIAFLPDSVSAAGKAKWQKIRSGNAHYNNIPDGFAMAYTLNSDSITGKNTMMEWFPVDRGMKGSALFSPSLDGLMAVLNLPPDKQSVQRYDSVSKSYQSGRVYTFEQSFFTPFGGYGVAAYKDLLYTYDHDSVPIYQWPRMKVKPYNYFRQNEYVAVLKDSASWLNIQKAVIIPDTQTYYLPDGGGIVKGRSLLRLISGWIKKGDMAPYPWVKQNQDTKNFRFEISGYAGDTTDWQDEGEVYGIKIINKKSGSVQVLDGIGAALSGGLNDVVQVQDCNFDGYPDIWIYAHNGGAGPNDGNNYYLFNPKTGQFEFNQKLSDLTQVSVDSKSKIITSAFRDGAGHHGGGTYTFTHDTLTQVAYWDDYCRGAFYCDYTKGQLINGHWQDSLFHVIYPADSNLKAFAEPRDNAAVMGSLASGYEMTILDACPLWFYIDGTDTKEKAVKGWVKKEAVLPKQWLPFNTNAGDFHFFAATPDSSELAAIGIKTTAAGGFYQIILVYQPLYYTDSLMQTGDFDHDGHVDFRLLVDGENEKPVYQYYLFKPQSRMFVLEKEQGPVGK